MDGPLLGLMGFACVVALIFVRVPVAIAMGMVGGLGYIHINGYPSFAFIMGKVAFDAAFPYNLSVVPLFVMMGVFAAHSGLSRSLYNSVTAFIGHFRGGLALATVGACGIFSAISGSSIATAATLGRVAIPEMRRHGYKDSLASAAVAAGGTLGVMIPPSVLLLIYGLMTEQSIGKLFMAGVVPGLLGVVLYMGAVVWVVWRQPESGRGTVRASWAARLRSLRSIWQVALLFLIVLGGMYLGWFSPTEAGAVGAFGALLLAIVGRHLTRETLKAALTETALTTGMIFMILIGAALFNYFIEASGLTDAGIQFVQDLGWGPWAVMLALMVFYIILGCFMDSMSMILLTIGAVFPLVTSLGFDPIWFGIMLVTVAEIAMITPPVGMNLFVLRGAVDDLNMGHVMRGVVPFVTADVVRMIIIAIFPLLATWLPSHMS